MDGLMAMLSAGRRAKQKEEERAIISQTMADCPLPPEILLMIIECYVAERHKELVAFRSKWAECETDEQYRALGEEHGLAHWPILPILTTAKFFHVTAIPLLYSRVTLLDGETLNDFCKNPALSSYNRIQELYVDAPDAYHANEIDEITDFRHLAMICTMVAKGDLFWNPKDVDAYDKFQDTYLYWREELLPKIGVLTVRNCRMGNLANISKLFRTGHLIVDGFYGAREPKVPLDTHPKVTLICDPAENYNREGGYTSLDTSTNHLFPSYGLDTELEWAIGGKTSRAGGPKSHASPVCAAETIVSLVKSFPYLSTFGCGRDTRILISPYLGPLGDDHSWCFAGPIQPVRTTLCEPDFVFVSKCDCGHGSKTHFWDGAREALLKYWKPLLERERDGDQDWKAEHSAKVLKEQYGT